MVEDRMEMLSEDNHMPFGELLRELRIENGIGLSKFAGLMELPTSSLAAIEHGRASPLPELRELLTNNLFLFPEKRRQLIDAPFGQPDKRNIYFS